MGNEDQLGAVERPKLPQAARWGFAQGPDGELIIRNWYFVFGASFLAAISILTVFSVPIVTLMTAPVAGWVLYLEWRGVEIHDGRITYPVRLGIVGDGVFEIVPIFQRSLPLSDVSNATTTTIRGSLTSLLPGGARVSHLVGEFGAAKIVFDSKAGRDRLFAILRDSYPHIKVYRWT